MNLNAIFAAIRATSSKLEKRAILAAHKDNELLKAFLKAVYDPRIQFNIKKLPDVGGYGAVEREFCMEDLNDFVNILPSMNGGKAAKEFLRKKLAKLDCQGCDLVGYLISRDVDAGIAENSVLEVWPDLFFIPPYQRCAKLDEKTKERFTALPYFYVQTKSDGQFAYVGNFGHEKYGDQRRFVMSRAGSIYPDWVAERIAALVPRDSVAMGELLIERNDVVLDRKTGNGILNSILSGDGSKLTSADKVVFVAWDMVMKEEFEAGESVRTYEDRLHCLRQTRLPIIGHWTCTSVVEAGIIQKQHLARKEEGTVWKDPSMGWRDCQSGDPKMVKAKLVFQADFEIEGAYVHKKNPNMLGGFSVKTRDGLMRFNVGSGFSEKQRLEFWELLTSMGMDSYNGTVVALEGNDIVTSKGKDTESVFLPIFIELRLDKLHADSRDDVWKEFNAAKQGKRAADLAE